MATAYAGGVPVRPYYPVHVEASGPTELSRWLWLVKWLLVIPHGFVLAFLWATFVVLSMVAFVAILVTGAYPRALFDFNVGVLRWTWRVAYYSYGVLATDRYPPFALAEVEDYPAHLHIDYPERLSRGLALVKWWLLALPHYVVLAALLGVTVSWVNDVSNTRWEWRWGGLIRILVVVAAIILAVTGRYPRDLYDLLLGLNRWVIRVAAYVGLMTDVYPPFRLDMGEQDGGPFSPGAAPRPGGPAYADAVGPPSSSPRTAGPPAGPPPGSGWTGGRVVVLVVGMLLALSGLAGLAAGGAVGFAHVFLRDGPYLMAPAVDVSSPGYAVVVGGLPLDDEDPYQDWPERVFGEVQVRVTSNDGTDVFVGIATAADAEAYLDGVFYSSSLGPGESVTEHAGGAPAVPPAAAGIWLADAAGPGAQAVHATAREGTWVVVVMAPDATRDVDARVAVGATVPWLPWAAWVLIAFGLLFTVGGSVLVAVASGRAAGRWGDAASTPRTGG